LRTEKKTEEDSHSQAEEKAQKESAQEENSLIVAVTNLAELALEPTPVINGRRRSFLRLRIWRPLIVAVDISQN